MKSKVSKELDLRSSIMGVKGKISFNRSLKSLTWLRVGGDAEIFFQPEDLQDLIQFVENLPQDTKVFPIGVCSNLLVRDGGIPGVTVRLGRGFSKVKFENGFICVGAAALDSKVAEFASELGRDLSFLRTIPGTIGGAIKMNAGCYGCSIEEVLKDAKVLSRCGKVYTMTAEDLGLSYRQSNLPDDWIVLAARLKGKKLPTDEIQKKMRLNQKKRLESQPVRERTGGSTFKNPASSPCETDDKTIDKKLSAWKLISESGLRGQKLGGASVSEFHSNFLINDGTATADDFERLGDFVQRQVFARKGIRLEWEIKRVGKRKQYHK